MPKSMFPRPPRGFGAFRDLEGDSAPCRNPFSTGRIADGGSGGLSVVGRSPCFYRIARAALSPFSEDPPPVSGESDRYGPNRGFGAFRFFARLPMGVLLWAFLSGVRVSATNTRPAALAGETPKATLLDGRMCPIFCVASFSLFRLFPVLRL